MSDHLDFHGSRNATKFLLEELVVFGGFLKESVGKDAKVGQNKSKDKTYIIHHVYITYIYMYLCISYIYIMYICVYIQCIIHTIQCGVTTPQHLAGRMPWAKKLNTSYCKFLEIEMLTTPNHLFSHVEYKGIHNPCFGGKNSLGVKTLLFSNCTIRKSRLLWGFQLVLMNNSWTTNKNLK